MAHILIVTRGLPSLVYPAIELARRLAAAGHRVTFAGDDTAPALLSSSGVDYLSLEPDGYDAFLQGDRRRALVRRYADVTRRRERARAALGVEGFRDALERERPDLVLVNGEMHAHIMTAFSAGIPVALLNTFVSIWRVPGMPPPHHLARPGSGWRGTRAGTALLWQNLRLRKRRRRSIARVRDAGCDRVSVLRDLARASGMEDDDLDERQWLIPFTYRRLPVLSLHAREFEFPHRPPAHVHYLGPMILASRQDGQLPAADRARLDALLANRRSPDRSRRLIYAGFGSVLSASLPFLRRLVRIVEERPSWDLVLSLSGRIAADDLGPLPPRVDVFRWVPQLEVLPHADVAITHGGINTVDECVASGVPMVIFCGGETDMAGTTSRVVYHGLGLAGSRGDTPAVIRGRVDHLLHDGEFRSTVHRFRLAYAAYAEQRIAERTVEALLASRSPRERRRR